MLAIIDMISPKKSIYEEKHYKENLRFRHFCFII